MTKIEHSLKKVDIDCIDLISSYLSNYPSDNCDFNICNLISWGKYYNLEYAVVEDRLILFNPYYSYLLFPIGEYFTANELLDLNNCCERMHNNVEIMVVPEDYILKNPDLEQYFDIFNDEDWNDYVYLSKNLVSLSGKKLAKKKNLISQFTRVYPDYEVKLISGSDFDQIIRFCEYWKEIQQRDDEYLDIEFEAIKNTLNYWDVLPVSGIKICVDNKLISFAVYSHQNNYMATVHFEKFDPNIKGSAQIVNYETAKVLEQRYMYINREQDMGDIGIRQAKRSYQPFKMISYYRLKVKK